MKKKTRITSLKSLKIEKTAILSLNADVVVGGKGGTTGGGPIVIIDTSVVFPTNPTQATACYDCPPRNTVPPFCIF